MNYFQIVQRVLTELRRPPVADFVLLVTPDHREILKTINTVNRTTLNQAEFSVRDRVSTLSIPLELTDPYTVVAKTIKGEVKERGLIIAKQSLTFQPEIFNFYTDNVDAGEYGMLDQSFYFKSSTAIRSATVLYSTINFAKTVGGVDQTELTIATDLSIIPDNLVDLLLVYGTCATLADADDGRLAFWNQQYAVGLKMLSELNKIQDVELSFSVSRKNLDIRRPLTGI